jgi:hypothetical protein
MPELEASKKRPVDPRILRILKENEKKNFVQRIIEPGKYPKMLLENGYVATHLMAWAQSGDKYVVYPTVQYDSKKKKLKRYQGKEAYQRAMRSGEYIEFDDPEEADWFSREYKQVWMK